jgi:hypothetical protein
MMSLLFQLYLKEEESSVFFKVDPSIVVAIWLGTKLTAVVRFDNNYVAKEPRLSFPNGVTRSDEGGLTGDSIVSAIW